MARKEKTAEIHLLDTDIDLAKTKNVMANCGREILAVKAVPAKLNDRRICSNCLDAHNNPASRKKQFTYTIVENFPR